MAKGYVPLFFDTFEETNNLTDEEFGRLIRAVGSYAKGNDDWKAIISGNERFAFMFLKGQVDRNKSISQKRAKAGSTRKEQNETNENKPKQRETKRNKNSDENPLFDKFWNSYPRRVNKQAARKAFEKINPNESVMEIILRELERQKKSPQWTKDGGQFIPHPATWLNGARWEDETPDVRPAANVTAQAYTQRDYDGEQQDAMKRMLEGVRA